MPPPGVDGVDSACCGALVFAHLRRRRDASTQVARANAPVEGVT